jgi:hypothetical protein
MQLTLTQEDAALLREILESTLSDLRMEIRETDSQAFRAELRTREQLLARVIGELGGAQRTA